MLFCVMFHLLTALCDEVGVVVVGERYKKITIHHTITVLVVFFICNIIYYYYKEICLFTVRHSMVAIYRIQMSIN
jgi:hypothetical protein